MRAGVILVALLSAAALAAHGWEAGAASVVLTPPVNGTTDYVRPIDEQNADSPGTCVPAFDQGTIPIGNGNSESFWVRDHVRGTVMALRDTGNTTLILLSADLYMLFANDLAVYHNLLRAAVGEAAYAQFRFVLASTHNHHGPDTSGLSGLNRDWYAWMINRLLGATLEALNSLRPVRLTVADGNWAFGLGDVRDPIIVDPRLTVLQAHDLASGDVVATVVQWAFHPEVTLGYSPTVPPEDCIAIGREPGCSAQGRYISADFPGHLQNYLKRLQGGGEVLFLNGPIGVQVGPHGPVWEVSEQYPITGDGSVAPPGATLLPRNFRKALLVGRELANAVVALLAGPCAVAVEPTTFDVRTADEYTYLSNPLFRLGLIPNPADETRPLIVGYTLRDLWICDVTQPPTDDVCVFDNYETVEDPIRLPFRKGNFVKIAVTLVRFGPITLLTLPGEVAPELANGVPADFDEAGSVGKYYTRPDLHAVGPAYTMPGVLKDMLECDYCFMVGLGNDEGGYLFPLSDWRLGCSGDACEFPGYNTGPYCKALIESGVQDTACLTGQLNSVEDHFEEVISIGWNSAEDFFNVVARLTGVAPRGRYTRDDWTVRV